MDFERDDFAWFQETRGSTNQIVDHQQSIVDKYLGIVDQARPSAIKDAVAAFADAVETRWYNQIYATGDTAQGLCDAAVGAQEWPYDSRS